MVEFELLTENDVIDIIAEVATTDANGEATTLSFLAQFSTSRVPVTSHTDDTVEVTSTPATEGDEAAVAPSTDADAPAADAAPVDAAAAPNAEETTETTTTTAPAAEETEVKTETAAPPSDKEISTATPAKKTTTTTTLAVDDWVSLSLEAVDGDDADSQAELHVTAKRIAIAEAIAEKNAELESKVAEIEDLKQQLKALQAATVKEQQQQKTSKATTASSTATKKKTTTSVAGKKKTTKATKKTTNKRASDDDDEDNEDEDDQQKKQSSVAKKSVFGLPSMAELQGLVLGGGMTVLNMAVANRAFVFFGLAALGVYKYGDYASV